MLSLLLAGLHADGITPTAETTAGAGTDVSAPKPADGGVWHPSPGSCSIDMDVINSGGIGVGLTHWYSGTHSQEDYLLAGYSQSGTADSQGTSGLFGQGTSTAEDLVSLQRFRLASLGRYADLNVVGGPALGYNYLSNQLGGQSSTEIVYSAGIELGLDTEIFFLPQWSLKVGYTVTGAWEKTMTSSSIPGLPSSTTFSDQWAVGTGAALAGLKYYFR